MDHSMITINGKQIYCELCGMKEFDLKFEPQDDRRSLVIACTEHGSSTVKIIENRRQPVPDDAVIV